MPHGDGLREVLVQPQGSGNGPGDSRYLQSVGHTGAVVVALRAQKNLGLMHQAAKGLAVDDPVRIPLEAGAHIVLPGLLRHRTAPGAIGKDCPGAEKQVLLTL